MNVLRILETAVDEAYRKKKISKKAYNDLDVVIRTALDIHEDMVGSVKTKWDK
jgi:hypothetical protein